MPTDRRETPGLAGDRPQLARKVDDGLDRAHAAASHGEVLPAQSSRLPSSHKHQAPDHELAVDEQARAF